MKKYMESLEAIPDVISLYAFGVLLQLFLFREDNKNCKIKKM